MISDQMLAEALVFENERRLSAYLSELEKRPEILLPPRTEKRLLRALRDMQHAVESGRSYHPAARKLIRVLLVAALLLALLFAAAMAYAPLRNAILYDRGDMMEILFADDHGSDHLQGRYSYLPEGYLLVSEEHNRGMFSSEYRNGNAALAIVSTKSSATLLLDTDGGKVEKVDVNGFPGYWVETDTAIQLAWSTGDYSHIITADRTDKITKTEIVKIAQSRSCNFVQLSKH